MKKYEIDFYLSNLELQVNAVSFSNQKVALITLFGVD